MTRQRSSYFPDMIASPRRRRRDASRALVAVTSMAVLSSLALVIPQGGVPAAAADQNIPAPVLSGPGAPHRPSTTPSKPVGHRSTFVDDSPSIPPTVKPVAATGTGAATLDGGVVEIGRVPVSIRSAKSISTKAPATPASSQGTAGHQFAVSVKSTQSGLSISVAPSAGAASAPSPGSAAPSAGHATGRLVIGTQALNTSGDALTRLRATTRIAGKDVRIPVRIERGGKDVSIPFDLAATTSPATASKSGSSSVDSPSAPAAMSVMLSSGASGSSGDYSATELSPASAWSVNEQTGGFSWAYPITVPGSAGGLDPELTLGYSSTSVDGRVSASNNQPSWVGEGFTLDPGHIDRSFAACRDDMTGGTNSVETGDLCWKNDNASIVFGGRASRLLKTSTANEWVMAEDDGTRVTHLTGASNGDQGGTVDGAGEYWRVTTTDGTQYYFGKGSTAAGATSSVWTVPVAGNQSGEPCWNAAFASGFCNQAWRWNLDYVVDVHGNSMTYTYVTESNRYGQNKDATSVQYDRGGYLKQIDYGQRSGAETAANATGRVLFEVQERCLPGGSVTCDPAQLTAANQAYWPDVPFDLICTATTTCGSTKTSPAFFSRKRLTAVTTQVLAAGALKDVARTDLTQSFPDPGDGTSAGLFLESVKATGYAAGGTATVPPIQFARAQMPNRVDTATDGATPMIKWRVTAISSETGASTAITYLPADCTATSLPAAKDTNSRRCFPMYWSPLGAPQPELGWFHTYPVSVVTEDAGVAGGALKKTTYTYGGGLAWHYDSNPVAPVGRRTWSENRGYATVTTAVGEPSQPGQLISTSTYLRGMNGDQSATGSPKTVTVTASDGTSVTDKDQFAGHQLEDVTYNGTPSSATEVEGTISTPWTSTARATDSFGGAYTTAVEDVKTRTRLSTGVYRTVSARTTYTSDGYNVAQVADAGSASASDERCTTYTYAPVNTGANLRGLVSTARTVDVACTTTPTAANTISDTRTYYDKNNTDLLAIPSKGEITKTEILADKAGGGTEYQQATRTLYDALGRSVSDFDASDRETKTVYTPADHTPTTSIKVTNPMLFDTITTIDARLGQPTSITDVNGKVTTIAYDDLARRTKVWTGSRAVTAVPNLEYVYDLSNTRPSVVTTKSLDYAGTRQVSSTAIFDALLRPVQTQTPVAFDATSPTTAAVGRSITDTIYDSRGLPIVTRGPWADTTSPPTGTYVSKQDQEIQAVTKTTFDGAGRPTQVALESFGVPKQSTSTVYNGDSVDVLPPAGASATRTISDARGRTTELRQYKSNTVTSTPGSWASTLYTTNNKDQLTGLTDADGASWTWRYDLLGRKTYSNDPDAGVSTNTYNQDGALASTTDANGKTTSFEYDSLGRKIRLWDGVLGAVGTTKSAEWVYDNTTIANGKGRPYSSTRYDPTGAYVSTVAGYTNDGLPTGSSLTVPTGQVGLTGTYGRSNVYYANGQLANTLMPGAPGLTSERQIYNYDTTSRVATLSGATSIISAVTRDEYGAIAHYQQMSTSGFGVLVNQTYEAGTHRLTNLAMNRFNQTKPEVNATYTYNPAGLITSVADVPDAAAPNRTDRQCFAYDPLGRLSDAWSNGSTQCAAAPIYTASGAAPYRTSWTYTDGGKRQTETQYAATDASKVVLSYAYPLATDTDKTPWHSPTRVTRTVGTGTGVLHQLVYDAVGRTTTTPLDWTSSTLTWNNEGQLRTIKRGSAAVTTANVYDADGTLLVKGEANGTKTLMLGDTQITYNPATSTATSRRLFTFEGQVVAVRTGTGLTGLYFTPPGPQGTAPIQVRASDQVVTKRYYTPFGDDRGTAPGWQGAGGFLAGTGATTDSITNLTHLGARDYDPNLGRFLSTDPVLTLGDPSQLNAYQYAGNDPVNFSDPSGLARLDGDRGPTASERAAGAKKYAPVFQRYYRKNNNPRDDTRRIQRERWVFKSTWDRTNHWWDDWGRNIAHAGTPQGQAEMQTGAVRGTVEAVTTVATPPDLRPYTQPIVSAKFDEIEAAIGINTQTFVHKMAEIIGIPLPGASVIKLAASASRLVKVAEIATETTRAVTLSAKAEIAAANSAGGVDGLLASISQEGKTAGVLDLDGELIPLVSGKGAMGNYAASGHVEGQAALIMRERGVTSGTLYIDNPNGICGYCTSQVPTLLPRGATLDVRTPAGTVPPSARWGSSRTFVGNEADPKPWPR